METAVNFCEAVNYGNGVSVLTTYTVTGQNLEECFESIWEMEYECIPWHFTHGMDYTVEDKYRERYMNWKRANRCFGKSEKRDKYKHEIDKEMRELYPYLYMKKG